MHLGLRIKIAEILNNSAGQSFFIIRNKESVPKIIQSTACLFLVRISAKAGYRQIKYKREFR